MAHRLIFTASAVACIAGMMIGCGSKDNPVAPAAGDASITGPAGSTVVFSEGFGGDLSKWEQQYMINVGDYYPQMRITTAAAHTGTHSITSDTSQSALEYVLPTQEYTGIAGVQFYVMATAKGEANFTVQIGHGVPSAFPPGRREPPLFFAAIHASGRSAAHPARRKTWPGQPTASVGWHVAKLCPTGLNIKDLP